MPRGMSNFSIDSQGCVKETAPSSPGHGARVQRLIKRAMSGFSMRSAGSAGGKSQQTDGTNGSKSAQSGTSEPENAYRNEPGARRVRIFNDNMVTMPASLNQQNGGRPNQIKTTKYTALTWIPKSLYAQFMKTANVYFLCISIIVLFDFSPKDPQSKVGPFIFMLLWTALKDLWEDSRRKRDDDKENLELALRYSFTKKGMEPVAWRNVHVGDILLVLKDQAFPADLILLMTAGGNEAFISTVMLDGESSLKERTPPKACELLYSPKSDSRPTTGTATGQTSVPSDASVEEQVQFFMNAVRPRGIEFFMGGPDGFVTSVRGTMQIGSGTATTGQGQADQLTTGWRPLTEASFLPRGCMLRNTEWVLGVAVYTGRDTKTRLKLSDNIIKFSNMQVNLNRCIRGLLVVLFIVCIYSATMSAVVGDPEYNPFIMSLVYLIALYHVVPLSLYITYEALKLMLGYLVNVDRQMIDPHTRQGAVARTADLMEEMGQVDFMFSDKTGTLTMNEMVFAKCHVGGRDLGDFRNGDEAPGTRAAQRLVQAEEASPLTQPPGERDDMELSKKVSWFFYCLATCHSVRVIDDSNQSSKESDEGATVGKYQGSSPDEVALVEIAHKVGVSFEGRERKRGSSKQELTIHVNGVARRATLLHILEFTSDRKRMSVVIKIEGKIFCITKGADSVLEDLLDRPFDETCRSDVQAFSRQGLRTLVVASKEIDDETYRAWLKDWEAARRLTAEAKETAIRNQSLKLETGLSLVGVTAVEDKLQEGVVEAIKTLKRAGVRVWMLTGDKLETATDIAQSCGLFCAHTHKAFVDSAISEEQVNEKLRAAAEEFQGHEDHGLVIDGRSLHFVMLNKEARQRLFQLGQRSKACVCCRMSPSQKLMVVQLVRSASPSTITLSVGDGANDVPMIEGAHVGVAIRGKEGAQAVQASDIAISQFRFVVPLMLCHGRRAYRRVAVFLCFFLYKNIVLVMGDIVWMHQCVYCGDIAFPEYLTIGFNMFFTSWHIFFVLGFDRDVPDEVANSRPELYHPGPARELFNGKVFTMWMFYAVYHGFLAWIVPNLFVGGTDYESQDFWVGSATAFCVLVTIVMLKLLLHSVSPWQVSTLVPTVASMLMLVLALATLGYTGIGTSYQPKMKGVPEHLITNQGALASLLLTPPAALLLDCVEMAVRKRFWPTALDKARREVASMRAAEAAAPHRV